MTVTGREEKLSGNRNGYETGGNTNPVQPRLNAKFEIYFLQNSKRN